MISVFKTCPKCRKKYLWNLDTGKRSCPDCKGAVLIKIIKKAKTKIRF